MSNNEKELATNEFNKINVDFYNWRYLIFNFKENKNNIEFQTKTINIDLEILKNYVNSAFKYTKQKIINNNNDNTLKEFVDYSVLATNDTIPFFKKNSEIIKKQLEVFITSSYENNNEYKIEESNGYLLLGKGSDENNNDELIFLFKHIPITLYKKEKKIKAKDILQFDDKAVKLNELKINYGTLYYTIDAIITKNFLYLLTDKIYKFFKIDSYVDKIYNKNIEFFQNLKCDKFDIKEFIKKSKNYKRYFCGDDFQEFCNRTINLINENLESTVKKYELELENFKEKDNIKKLIYFFTGKQVYDERLGRSRYMNKEEKFPRK